MILDYIKNFFNKPGDIITLTYNGNKISGIFFPAKKNFAGSAIVYCHGGFGGTGDASGYVDAIKYAEAGFPVFLIKYENEGTRGINLPKDVDEVGDGAKALKEFLKKINRLFLLGVSRGGFVAYHVMAKYNSIFDGCIIHAAPTDLTTWVPIAERLKAIPEVKMEDEIKPYFTWLKTQDNPLFKSSPIAYIHELRKKPMSLNYGIQDLIVPDKNSKVDSKYWQGEPMYRALVSAPDIVKRHSYKVWDLGHGLAMNNSVIKYNIDWMVNIWTKL